MIPKVASLPSLAAGASARTGLAWRNAQVTQARQEAGSSSSNHNRRRSLDARPRSRTGSAADLVSLGDGAAPSNSNAAEPPQLRAESPALPTPSSRPISPALPANIANSALWTVAESPSCTPYGSFNDSVFPKLAPLPPKPTSPLKKSAAAQNTDGVAVDVLGAAALDQQPAPLLSSTAAADADVDASDDLAVLTAACGDLDVDEPVTHSAPAPIPALASAAAAVAPAAPAPIPPSPFNIAAALAVAAATSAEPAIATAAVTSATKPAPPPALELPLAPSSSSSPDAPPVPAPAVATKKAASKKAAGGAKEARPASPPASPPAALSFPPRAHEVHVYHAHANFSYVQELLGNLQHVHHMFKGAAGSGSGAAAAGAVAAARMLSRSLSRAAQRVRMACLGPLAPAPSTSTPGIRLVGGPATAAAKPQAPCPSPDEAAARVVLAREAMHTLTEFGWAELVTCDAEQAKLVGALDLEVHNLATGRVDAYHRHAPGHPWVHVGISGAGTTSAAALAALLGPTISAWASGGGGSPLGPLSRAASSNASGSADDAACSAGGALPPAPPCSPAAFAASAAAAGLPSSGLPSTASVLSAGGALSPAASGALVELPGAGGSGVTVARFAQQLQEAGAAVLAAAQLLQQWIDDLRAATDAAAAAVGGGDASSSPSPSSSSPSCATPQLVTAAV